MTTKRGGWISKRGQADACAAIEQVIERSVQAGEQVRQVPDGQVEDSPYQARQPFADGDVAELAQGMRAAGFHGVLLVRPHSDTTKRRQGIYQLVYGHRRRLAWRLVCAERGEPCLLPVVVREIGDEELLTIGAQENLQRRDLGPVEEAQLVAWHERVFFDKSQAEIGALLGKSSDWVSVRARVHWLPDALKATLQQRPRVIAQMLELGPLYARQPDVAVTLAERVVHENLSLDALRALVRGYVRPERTAAPSGIPSEGQDVATSTVQQDDGEQQRLVKTANRDESHERRGAATRNDEGQVSGDRPRGDRQPEVAGRASGAVGLEPSSGVVDADGADLLLLEEAAAALVLVAARAETLPVEQTISALDQIERAVREIREALGAGLTRGCS